MQKTRNTVIYNRKWRDPKNLEVPKNIEPVIRFKSKISGNTLIKDLVQGDINISNYIIEDFVILQKKKLNNKKQKLKKVGYLLFIIENGEILRV